MEKPTKVKFSKRALKQCQHIPAYLNNLIDIWAQQVELLGIRKIRERPAYHDKPLQGDRWGQRSVRLNRAYRLFYIQSDNEIEILIIEVNKHDY